ncbi:MAG: hypothetical protein AVDCRST_MAG21-63 [uncultured Nocardioidaceae bacterium]|uniref:Uncharacterized protein n=1 Tax=uncultured Nocardioidaceae bacterium TaxID=253824 RepID=A0A6J4MPD8_9ACTN|nr:MAG: hypothetical protein AVDCRST_MAG21-63 [uncultured Nocardioidaceae bacterium]
MSPRDPHLTSFHHLRALAYLSLGDLKGAARRCCMDPAGGAAGRAAVGGSPRL